ncbi:MAG: aldo/keto reductase, partial [Chloroflexota bacterium]
DETLEALTDVVRQGKVRYIGCSNFPAYLLMRGLWLSDVRGLSRLDCIQSRFNILSPGLGREAIPMCREEGVAVTAYSPMASGLLTGKHDRSGPSSETKFGARDAERGNPLMKRYWHDHTFDTLDALRHVADESGQPLMRLALQWVRETPGVASTIIGARREDQITSTLDAWQGQASEDVMARVREIADRHAGNMPMDYPPPVPAL